MLRDPSNFLERRVAIQVASLSLMQQRQQFAP
jgi:hypothetical protein